MILPEFLFESRYCESENELGKLVKDGQKHGMRCFLMDYTKLCINGRILSLNTRGVVGERVRTTILRRKVQRKGCSVSELQREVLFVVLRMELRRTG